MVKPAWDDGMGVSGAEFYTVAYAVLVFLRFFLSNPKKIVMK